MKNKYLTSNLLINIVCLIISIILALIIGYKFIDQILFISYFPYIINIILRFIAAYIFYLTIKWIIYGKINYFHKHILFIIYIIFMLYGLIFSRPQMTYQNPINIKHLNIFNQPVLLTITNMIMFVPLGLYLKNNKFKFIIIILSSIAIETIQLISKRGIFDIEDIILNSLGAIAFILIFNKFNIKIFNYKERFL